MDRKKNKIQKWIFGLLSLVIILPVCASFNERLIDLHKTKFNKLAMDLWDYSELGYQEIQSVNAIANILEDEGFIIKKNVANIPTAFIAEYGNGGPIIGILGELMLCPVLHKRAQHLEKLKITQQALVKHVVIIYLELHHHVQHLLLKIGYKKIILKELSDSMEHPQKKVVLEKFIWFALDYSKM